MTDSQNPTLLESAPWFTLFQLTLTPEQLHRLRHCHASSHHSVVQRIAEEAGYKAPTGNWGSTFSPAGTLLVTVLGDRSKLSTAAEYALLVDSLTQYGGGTRSTAHDFELPADGIFRVWTEHYDPNAKPAPDHDYSSDGDDQTNNVYIELAFAVDFDRLKLLLADAEYDLVGSPREWTDAECWSIEGDGFENALALHRFNEQHHPAEEVGVCFLAEWEG